jgi:hypothetical protein
VKAPNVLNPSASGDLDSGPWLKDRVVNASSCCADYHRKIALWHGLLDTRREACPIEPRGLIIVEDRKPVVSSFRSLKGTLRATYLSYSQFVEDEGVAEPTDLDPDGPRFQSVEFSYQILALPWFRKFANLLTSAADGCCMGCRRLMEARGFRRLVVYAQFSDGN